MFYLSLDMDYKVYALKNELDYVSNNWRMIGRPTIIIPVLEESLGVLLKIANKLLFINVLIWFCACNKISKFLQFTL